MSTVQPRQRYQLLNGVVVDTASGSPVGDDFFDAQEQKLDAERESLAMSGGWSTDHEAEYRSIKDNLRRDRLRNQRARPSNADSVMKALDAVPAIEQAPGALASAGRAAGQGLTGVVSSAMKGAATYGLDPVDLISEFSGAPPAQRPLYRAASALDRFMGTYAPENQEHADSFWLHDVPQGIGSTIPFVATGGAAAALAAPELAATAGAVAASGLGAMSGAGTGYEAAKAKGASEGTALAAGGLHAIPGALEGVLPGALLEERMAGAVAKRAGESALARVLGVTALGGVVEAGQEGVQNTLDNLIAKGLYDPGRAPLEGVGRSMLAAGVAGGMFGAAEGVHDEQARQRGKADDPDAQRAAHQKVQLTQQLVQQHAAALAAVPAAPPQNPDAGPVETPIAPSAEEVDKFRGMLAAASDDDLVHSFESWRTSLEQARAEGDVGFAAHAEIAAKLALEEMQRRASGQAGVSQPTPAPAAGPPPAAPPVGASTPVVNVGAREPVPTPAQAAAQAGAGVPPTSPAPDPAAPTATAPQPAPPAPAPAPAPVDALRAALGLPPREKPAATAPPASYRTRPPSRWMKPAVAQEAPVAEEPVAEPPPGGFPARTPSSPGGVLAQRAQDAQQQRTAPGETTPADVVEEAAKREYASTQVALPDDIAAGIREHAASIPDEDLAEDGREDNPHVTVKYGLHSDDVEAVRAALAGEGPIRVKLGKTSIFPNGESNAGDVVKVDVDSPDLHRLNAKIGALPHTDTHPDYKPHATIAYVKPGLGKKYAGDARHEGREAVIDRITVSGKDDTETEIPLTGKPAAPATVPKPKKPVTPQLPPSTAAGGYAVQLPNGSRVAVATLAEARDALMKAGYGKFANGGRTGQASQAAYDRGEGGVYAPDGTRIAQVGPNGRIFKPDEKDKLPDEIPADLHGHPLSEVAQAKIAASKDTDNPAPGAKEGAPLLPPSPAPGAGAVFGSGKEFWQKTRAEVEAEGKAAIKHAKAERAAANKMKPSAGYASWRIKSTNETNKQRVKSAEEDLVRKLAAHRERVAEAVAEGKDVPARVLADYPDLKREKDKRDAAEGREYDELMEAYVDEVINPERDRLASAIVAARDRRDASSGEAYRAADAERDALIAERDAFDEKHVTLEELRAWHKKRAERRAAPAAPTTPAPESLAPIHWPAAPRDRERVLDEAKRLREAGIIGDDSDGLVGDPDESPVIHALANLHDRVASGEVSADFDIVRDVEIASTIALGHDYLESDFGSGFDETVHERATPFQKQLGQTIIDGLKKLKGDALLDREAAVGQAIQDAAALADRYGDKRQMRLNPDEAIPTKEEILVAAFEANGFKWSEPAPEAAPVAEDPQGDRGAAEGGDQGQPADGAGGPVQQDDYFAALKKLQSSGAAHNGLEPEQGRTAKIVQHPSGTGWAVETTLAGIRGKAMADGGEVRKFHAIEQAQEWAAHWLTDQPDSHLPPGEARVLEAQRAARLKRETAEDAFRAERDKAWQVKGLPPPKNGNKTKAHLNEERRVMRMPRIQELYVNAAEAELREQEIRQSVHGNTAVVTMLIDRMPNMFIVMNDGKLGSVNTYISKDLQRRIQTLAEDWRAVKDRDGRKRQSESDAKEKAQREQQRADRAKLPQVGIGLLYMDSRLIEGGGGADSRTVVRVKEWDDALARYKAEVVVRDGPGGEYVPTGREYSLTPQSMHDDYDHIEQVKTKLSQYAAKKKAEEAEKERKRKEESMGAERATFSAMLAAGAPRKSSPSPQAFFGDLGGRFSAPKHDTLISNGHFLVRRDALRERDVVAHDALHDKSIGPKNGQHPNYQNVIDRVDVKRRPAKLVAYIGSQYTNSNNYTHIAVLSDGHITFWMNQDYYDFLARRGITFELPVEVIKGGPKSNDSMIALVKDGKLVGAIMGVRGGGGPVSEIADLLPSPPPEPPPLMGKETAIKPKEEKREIAGSGDTEGITLFPDRKTAPRAAALATSKQPVTLTDTWATNGRWAVERGVLPADGLKHVQQRHDETVKSPNDKTDSQPIEPKQADEMIPKFVAEAAEGAKPVTFIVHGNVKSKAKGGGDTDVALLESADGKIVAIPSGQYDYLVNKAGLTVVRNEKPSNQAALLKDGKPVGVIATVPLSAAVTPADVRGLMEQKPPGEQKFAAPLPAHQEARSTVARTGFSSISELEATRARIASIVNGKFAVQFVRQILADPSNPEHQESLAEHGITSGGPVSVPGVTDTAKKVVKLAYWVTGADLDRVSRHEAGHALRALGMISDEDWGYLSGVYSDEEETMDGYAAWSMTGKAPSPKVDSIFKKLRRTLTALGSYLRGQGWLTPEAVFARSTGAGWSTQQRTLPTVSEPEKADDAPAKETNAAFARDAEAAATVLARMYKGKFASQALSTFLPGITVMRLAGVKTHVLARWGFNIVVRRELRTGLAANDLTQSEKGLAPAERVVARRWLSDLVEGTDTTDLRKKWTAIKTAPNATVAVKALADAHLEMLAAIERDLGGNPAEHLWKRKQYQPGQEFQARLGRDNYRKARFLGYRKATVQEERTRANTMFGKAQKAWTHLKEQEGDAAVAGAKAAFDKAARTFERAYALPEGIVGELFEAGLWSSKPEAVDAVTEALLDPTREIAEYEYLSQSKGEWVKKTADRKDFDTRIAPELMVMDPKPGTFWARVVPKVEAWRRQDDAMKGEIAPLSPTHERLGNANEALGTDASGHVPRHYPHTYTPEARDAAGDPGHAKHVLIRGAIDLLAQKLQKAKVPAAQAYAIAEQKIAAQVVRGAVPRTRVMGSIEEERAGVIPFALMDHSEGVTARYFTAGQQRIDEYERFAKDKGRDAQGRRIIVRSPGQGISDELQNIRLDPRYGPNVMQHASDYLDFILGVAKQATGEKPLYETARALSDYTYITKLADPIVNLKNLPQSLTSGGVVFGPWRGFAGYVAQLKAENWSKAQKSGAVTGASAVDTRFDDEADSSFRSKLVSMSLIGQRKSEVISRAASTWSAWRHVQDLVNFLHDKQEWGAGRKAFSALATLGEYTDRSARGILADFYEFSPTDIARFERTGKLTEDDALHAMLVGSMKVNFRPDPNFTPNAINARSALGRLVRTLRGFAYSNTKLVVGHVTENARRGNVKPLASILLSAGIPGSMFILLKSWLKDREDESDYFDGAWRQWAHRVLWGTVEMGVTALIDRPESFADPMKIMGPGLDSLRDFRQALGGSLERLEKDPSAGAFVSQWWRFAESEVTAIRTMEDLYRKTGGSKQEAERRFQRARSAGILYDRSNQNLVRVGLEAARKGAIDYQPGPWNHEVEKAKDALMTFDYERARQAVVEGVDAMMRGEGIQAKQAAARIKSGLTNKAPLSGHISKTERAAFYEWLKKNRGEAFATEVMTTDQSYRDAVNALLAPWLN